ncbi:MAG: hypothetical protein DHS20C14_03270 [Phycisphaeraceae bacterium]|nr:MAG: hypothetical protein DHS20C14_03270 [Phycisphaeraceae bacterium]
MTTTYELIEQAVLDALGILDPSERDAFEASLAQASPEIKAQVREEQGRLLDLEALLPDDAPRPELRELVLAAVRAAVSEEATPVVGRVGGAAVAARQPRATFRPAKRVSRMWRAAAIAFGAAFVGMTAMTLEVNRMYSEAGSRALVDTLYEHLGADALNEMVFDPETQRVVLTSMTDSTSGPKAAVWHNPDWDSARLFVSQLRTEPGERLRLVVLDDAGNIVANVREFESSGEFTDLRVKIDLGTERRFAICREGQNVPLLSTLSSEL